MLKISIFMVTLLLSVAFAGVRGSAPERIAALLMTIAALLSLAMPYNGGHNFDQLYAVGFKIDFALFIGLAGVAATANRFWPLWLAGLQLLTIAVHLAKAYDPDILPLIYARAAGELAYPMIIILVIGTVRHRDRVRQRGGERDWSPIRW